MRLDLIALAAALGLSGCASLEPPNSFLGRPVAEAVQELGSPVSVTDYKGEGRYFSWTTSDVRIEQYGADNPRNWFDPTTREIAPQSPDDEALEALPELVEWTRFRPPGCSFTLVARWDAGARTWIAQKEIRRGAGSGGHCGLRG